jgi:hypothetical protein
MLILCVQIGCIRHRRCDSRIMVVIPRTCISTAFWGMPTCFCHTACERASKIKGIEKRNNESGARERSNGICQATIKALPLQVRVVQVVFVARRATGR